MDILSSVRWTPLSSQIEKAQQPKESKGAGKGKKKKGADAEGGLNKVATRLFAFQVLFSKWLPPVRPSFVSEETWQSWKSDSNFVVLNRFCQGQVVLTFPQDYDIIVHSRVNYGDKLVKCSPKPKTRYRWWSDTSVGLLGPIKNTTTGKFVERIAFLPIEITSNPYLASLAETDKGRLQLMKELANLFGDVLAKVLPEDTIESRKMNGFGVSRSKSLKSQVPLTPEAAFQEAVKESLRRWQQIDLDDD